MTTKLPAVLALATLAFAGCGASTTTSYNEAEPPTQHLPTVTQAVVQPAHTTTQPAPEHYKPHPKPHTHEIGAVVEDPNEPAEHDELEEEEGVK